MECVIKDKKGIDVVGFSVFHEVWSPNFDNVDVKSNYGHGWPNTIHQEVPVDPCITEIPKFFHFPFVFPMIINYGLHRGVVSGGDPPDVLD